MSEEVETETRETETRETDFADVYHRIRAGDVEAVEVLYGAMNTGIRYYIVKRLRHGENGVGDSIDDHVHNCFLMVMELVVAGKVREPEKLMGYVLAVVKFYMIGEIRKRIIRRERFRGEAYSMTEEWGEAWRVVGNPLTELLSREEERLLGVALGMCSEKDREILRRAYLNEEDREVTKREMGWTDTDYRNNKNRAKGRLIERMKSLYSGRGRVAGVVAGLLLACVLGRGQTIQETMHMGWRYSMAGSVVCGGDVHVGCVDHFVMGVLSASGFTPAGGSVAAVSGMEDYTGQFPITVTVGFPYAVAVVTVARDGNGGWLSSKAKQAYLVCPGKAAPAGCGVVR